MKATSLVMGLVIGLLAFGTAAHADVLADVKKAGELKIGTETAFPPFDYIDAGDHVGMNVDLFEQVGKELGVKVTWVALPWEGVLPALEAHKFDMVAGPVTITKARMDHYVFTSPIAEATVSLVKRKGDTSVNKPEDIAGKTVASGRASSQLDQLKTFAATLNPKPDVRDYVGANEGFAALAAGRITAWANSLPNNAAAVKMRPDTFELVQPPFGTKVYFGYLGRKDTESAGLMTAIDDAIAKIKADGRMGEIQKKWFGTTFDVPASAGTPNL